MHRKFLSTLKVGLALFVAVFSNGLLPATAAYAAAGDVQTVNNQPWGNQGAEYKTLSCKDGQTTYWHWILTPGGNNTLNSATLNVTYDSGAPTTTTGVTRSGGSDGALHFDVDRSLSSGSVTSASVSYTYTEGTGSSRAPFVLTISDSSCKGTATIPKDATADIVVTDPTCDSNGIATTTGVVNASLVGTLDQTVGAHTATFTADTGHQFADGSTSLDVPYTIAAKLTGEECETNEPTPIPLPAGIADICGTANDTVPLVGEHYTIKTDSGWVKIGEGPKYQRTITYVTAEGYVFTPSEGWVVSRDGTEATYVFTDWGTPCPTATAGTVTFSEVCGTKDDTYTIPTTANVIYKVNGTAKDAGTYAGTGTITVVAEAAPGYVLTAPYTVSHTFSTEPCQEELTCPKNTEWSDINKNGRIDEDECFKKVFVCKYVGTPGINERLQTGDNPISVSVNAIKDFKGIGSYFNDAQGRSYVLAFDEGQAEPDVSECPGRENPTVVVLETPCVEFGQTGSFTIRVTNNNDYSVKYRVNIQGGAKEIKQISAHSYYDFTFSGYAVGTYKYNVYQQVAHDTKPDMSVPAFSSRIAPERDFEFKWERVAHGTVTLTQCPATEVVATAPTFQNPTCDITTGRVIIPTKTGVTYKINGEVKAAGIYNYAASSSVTVTAEAASAAYVLSGSKSWNNTFAAVPTNCILGETDVCPNIDGSQATVPVGYTKDSNGNCNKTVGQVLATSAVLPATLPSTGPESFLSQWLPMIAAALTYFVTRSARSLKKA